MTGTVITFYSYRDEDAHSALMGRVAARLREWGHRVLVVDLGDWRKKDLRAEYRDHGFGEQLEEYRARWVDDHDFVLISSASGTTDLAGVCAAQLPDRLVLVLGSADVRHSLDALDRIAAARDRLPYDRPQLQVLPVPRGHHDAVAPLLDNWVDRDVPASAVLRHLADPHVVAAVVAHRFSRTDLLVDDPGGYLASARNRTSPDEDEEAISLLEGLSEWRLHPERWDHVRETLVRMRAALDDDEELARLTARLELVGPVRAEPSEERQAIPPGVRELAARLVRVLRRGADHAG
ncbi:CATRA system-associated protein [Saccharothrix xinjiangensis]|uniref:CATRA system-associated protein n=1 Tax=Saccharothrix xinjiangensis TaxID=204798 RepID=A0ABV9Y9E4_9PSEU